jgi:hypothetical protein
MSPEVTAVAATISIASRAAQRKTVRRLDMIFLHSEFVWDA